MSDLDVRAVRAWLATQAVAANGVRRAVSWVPDKITARDLPLVVIGNPSIGYNRGFGRGRATLTFPVFALVSEALSSEIGTTKLDAFVSLTAASSAAPASLSEKLRQEVATSPAPWVSKPESVGEYTLYQYESAQYYGVEITVVVTT